jgi:hypothetical protein
MKGEQSERPANGRLKPRSIGRWAAELVLVFVGAYAAFWLNGYQERQRDAERRDAILASLEQDTQQAIGEAHNYAAQLEPQATAFRKKVESGEMPTIGPFVFITDYSPTDTATLLQSGGAQLLSAKTQRTLRKVESTLRSRLARMARYEKLSDELIVPNADQGREFFYDPATRKLRKRFEWCPKSLEDAAQLFRDLEKSETELLTEIQAERQERR